MLVGKAAGITSGTVHPDRYDKNIAIRTIELCTACNDAADGTLVALRAPIVASCSNIRCIPENGADNVSEDRIKSRAGWGQYILVANTCLYNGEI